MQFAGMLGLAPRLPPGSLGFGGVARLGDEGFYLRKFQRHGPVFKILWNRNVTICVVGFRRARHLFAVHAQAIAPLHIDIRSFVPHGFLRMMEGETHAHYRKLFLNALRADPLTAREPDVRHTIRAELQLLAAADGDPAGASERMTATLDRLVMRSLLIAFVGLTERDEPLLALEAGYRRLGPRGFVFPIGPEQIQAFGELRSIVRQVISTIEADPAESSAQSVLARLIELREDAPLDETVVGNLIYMIELGRYDLRSLLRWVLKYLADHPATVAELRATRGSEAFAGLAEACVNETLRLDQAEALTRMVREEFVFEGYRIPSGVPLRVLMREAHQNADVFPEPERYNPCRFVGKTYSLDDYSPFGVGEHRCIVGKMVVRLCAMVVEELVAGFDWTVAGDGPRIRGRHHWEPAPDFALVLRPRADA